MIYVSVTTIPQRIKTINKSIESLINQTVKPDKIFINIPKIYKRFEKKIEDNEVPNFPEIVEVTRCNDFGPGTKLLGSINKIDKNSLLILADDDHVYENFMIEKFNDHFILSPNNAYSFYVHPLGNLGVGQGADGFAINTDHLDGIEMFYDKIVKDYKELFIHDDLWISYYLFFIKRIKVLSLQKYLKMNEDGKRKTIYEIHNSQSTLISNYGSNIIQAVQERDKRAVNSIKYIQEKTKGLKF